MSLLYDLLHKGVRLLYMSGIFQVATGVNDKELVFKKHLYSEWC